MRDPDLPIDGPGIAGGTDPRYAIIEFDHTTGLARILPDTEASTYTVSPAMRQEAGREAEALAAQARAAGVKCRSYLVTYMETVEAYPVRYPYLS